MTASDGASAGLRDAAGFAADEPYRRALVAHRLFGAPAPTIGRFVLAERIGAGAMGVVYRARDPRLDRPVALKLLRAGLTDVAAQRMLREARALARVEHPNVVTIYEVGDVDGHPFIAMEYVAGQTLAEWQQGRSAEACLEAYTAAAAGLIALHAAGLVHRDFKPTNTLVGDDGRVRVADLGLVRGVDDRAGPAIAAAQSPAALTATGSLLGTPAYMAPEQHAGRPATPRSDQYALCVALVEALTGERPIAGEVSRHSAVTPRLHAALRRGLALAPEERWPDVAALVEAWSAPARSTAWRAWALAAGVVVAVLAFVMWSARQPADDPVAEDAAPPTQTAAFARVERLLTRDPTLATALLAELDPRQPAWAPLARRVLTTPVARATVRLDADAHRLELRPEKGLLAWLDDGDLAEIGPDGIRHRRPAPALPTRARSARWTASIADGQILIDEGGTITPIGAAPDPAARLIAEPSGRWLAVQSAAGITIRPWPADGRPIRTLPPTRMLWFIDADTVAHEPEDGVVELTALTSGRTHALRGHARAVIDVVADETRVITVTQARIVRIWSRATFEGAVLGRHGDGIWSAARDPSRRWLVTAGHDSKIGLLDLRTDRFERLAGHTAPSIFNIAFSPDGARFASTGGDRTARIWSVAPPHGPTGALAGHEGWAYAVAWSPDGRWIATGDRQGGVRVAPANAPAEGRLIGRHPGDRSMRRVHTLVFTGDSGAIISGAKNGTLIRWPFDGGPSRVLPRGGNGADVGRLAPDRVLTIDSNGTARVLADDGAVVARFPSDVSIVAWAVAAAGDRFATSHADGSVRVWDLAKPAEPRWLHPPGDGPAETLAFDQAAQRLAVGDMRGGMKVFAVGEAQPRWRLGGHGDAVRYLAFDGHALISASFDGTVRRWAVPGDAEGLQRRVRAHVTDCLLVSQRIAWLGEAEDDARAGHAACVAAQRDGRAAAFAP